MKAIRVHELGGPEVMRLQEIPDPQPAADEVLVRIEAIGVNFIEVYQRKGQYQMKLPFTPGREGAGAVVAVGADVATIQIGDRVASEQFAGAYAELAVAKANRVMKLPDAVPTEIGAAVMLQGLTAHYLTTTTYPLERGDRCLIHAAAGGVGLLFCQMAKRRGAWLVGTTSTDEKAALARNAGADEIIFYTKQDFVAEVRRLTGGKGLHVVYDSVGKTTFDGSLDCIARRGMMVLFGQSSGPVPPVDPQLLNRKGSLFLTRPNLADYVGDPDELAARAVDLLGWVTEGWLHVHVDRAYPLAEAAEAHRALESRATAGKVLVRP